MGRNKSDLFSPESPKTLPAKTPKKMKVEVYKLSQQQKSLIKNDQPNKKLWDEAMESLSLGPVTWDFRVSIVISLHIHIQIYIMHFPH